jgi:hypothetical protein
MLETAGSRVQGSKGRTVEHPLMAVALKLTEDFPGQSMTVLRVVAEVADDHPGGDLTLVESVARARLRALLGGRVDSPGRDGDHRTESDVPLPQQRAAS